MQSYVLDILEGLKYIHNQGVVHADIKMDNILLQSSDREDEYDKVKICDFGLSQKLNHHTGKAFSAV